MQDRLTPGLLAGFIGDIVQQIYFHIAKYLGITDRTYLEYGKVLIMFEQYKGVLPFIVAMTFELIIGGLLGIILSYVIKYTSSRFYILKAVTIAITAWLFFLSPGTFFNLPLFKNVPPSASIIMLVGSIIWGLVTAIALKKLTKDFRSYFTEKEL
ncbi:MAG: hypothetical protein AAGU27_02965 [Dehalobacterium sp.]